LPDQSLEELIRFREPVTDGGDATLMHTEVALVAGGGVWRMAGIAAKWFGMSVGKFGKSCDSL
jgi:hypothetical protein